MKPFQEKRRTQEKDFKFLPVTYCTQRKRAQIVSYFTAFPGIICLTVQVKVLDSYNSCVQAVHYMDDFTAARFKRSTISPASICDVKKRCLWTSQRPGAQRSNRITTMIGKFNAKRAPSRLAIRLPAFWNGLPPRPGSSRQLPPVSRRWKHNRKPLTTILSYRLQ